MNELITFYEDFLRNIGIAVDEKTKQLFLKSGDKNLPFTIEGIPLYLPTKEVIRTMIDKNENGEVVLVKELFNPLEDNVVKVNKSLNKLREYIVKLINHSFAIVSEVTLNLLVNEDINVEDLGLLKAIDKLYKYKSQNLKKPIDETTIKNFINLYEKLISLPLNRQFINIFIKKGGKIGDEKYNRIATITFPVYEDIVKLIENKEHEYLGIKFRKKDLMFLKAFYETLLDMNENEILEGIQIGTKDNVSPSFIVLIKAYEWLSDKINGFIDMLETANFEVDVLEDAKLPYVGFTSEELESNTQNLKKFLLEIPSENDISILDKTVKEDDEKDSILSKLIKKGVENNNNNEKSSLMKDLIKEDEPVEDEEDDPVKKLSKRKNNKFLFGNSQQNMFGNAYQQSIFNTSQQGFFGNSQQSIFGDTQQSIFNSGISVRTIRKGLFK